MELESELRRLVLPIYVSLSTWGAESYIEIGDFDRALDQCQAGLRAATQIGYPASIITAHAYLGQVHVIDIGAPLKLLNELKE